MASRHCAFVNLIGLVRCGRLQCANGRLERTGAVPFIVRQPNGDVVVGCTAVLEGERPGVGEEHAALVAGSALRCTQTSSLFSAPRAQLTGVAGR